MENNYLEAAGENVLFGGTDPTVTNLVPSDILLRRNHLFKPFEWRNAILAAPGGVRTTVGTGGALASGKHYFRVVTVMTTGTRTAVSAPSTEVSATVGASGKVTVSWSAVPGADKYRVYRGTAAGVQSKYYFETTATSFGYSGTGEVAGTPATTGTKWVVKNTFELKNAQRVTVDGNLFENCWAAGRYRYTIVLTPRNSGSAPWTRVQNVTFTNNIVRHVPGVVNVAGFDNSDPTGRTERITFRNNLFEDINHTAYGTNTKALLVGGGAATLVFDRNTIIHTNSSVLYAARRRDAGARCPRTTCPGITRTESSGDGPPTGTPTIAKSLPRLPSSNATCSRAGTPLSIQPPMRFPR